MVNSGTEPLDRAQLCACCGDSSGDEHSANHLQEQRGWGGDDEDADDARNDGSAIEEWLRAVSVAESDVPDYERFNRDGIPWYWVFDTRGRPTAVPDDLAIYPPAAASAGDPTLSDGNEDNVGDEVEYLPSPPDVPRLENGYQADDDEDGDDFEPEPWLTWPDFCDLTSADAAWVRFDIDDEGREIGWIVGETGEEDSEDDELVFEGCLVSRIC